MARGTPDGRIQEMQFAGQVTDLALVYSMLWGFSPIDSQGRIMYLDTFNNGLGGWTRTISGTGADPILASPFSYAFSPPNVVTLGPGLTSGSISQINREIYAGKSYRLGIEGGFSFGSAVQPRLSIDYNPVAGSPYFGRIKFFQASGLWAVQTGAGPAYTTFYTPGAPTSSMLMQVKVTMDFLNGKYIHAFVGDMDFDLSSLNLAPSSSSYNGLLIAAASNESKGAGASNMQLGYVLITKDEP